jgi:hypothetical protein
VGAGRGTAGANVSCLGDVTGCRGCAVALLTVGGTGAVRTTAGACGAGAMGSTAWGGRTGLSVDAGSETTNGGLLSVVFA